MFGFGVGLDWFGLGWFVLVGLGWCSQNLAGHYSFLRSPSNSTGFTVLSELGIYNKRRHGCLHQEAQEVGLCDSVGFIGDSTKRRRTLHRHPIH